jgi:3-oxoacyl-[acyl-carrier-protein] synthase-1
LVSRKFGLSGPSLTVSTACASGAGAVAKGAELIRAGFCDAVIAGGADVVSETVLLGFNSLETLSGARTNPFSKNRDGITLGEGAAFFVMSRDAGSGIELLGAGESADAFHMTLPRPDGGGAERAMKAALASAKAGGAGIDAGDVGYVNLHGTGTPANDRMEARAVAAVFPDYQRSPLVSSTKPVTGHTLGAAGALELALCWMILTAPEIPADAPPRAGGRGVPVHCWDGVYDEELPRLRFAAPGDRAERLRICMSNSFAFGGCNVSLILGRTDR